MGGEDGGAGRGEAVKGGEGAGALGEQGEDEGITRLASQFFLHPFCNDYHGHHHSHLGRREIPYGDDMIRFPRGAKFQRGFSDGRPIPMRWPWMLKEFLGKMWQILTRMPEFERGLRKERPAMVHGMREAEGRQVSREEKVKEKHKEREDGDLMKWTGRSLTEMVRK